ncbi:LysR family transcriptional regulator [soil metagenome]
MARYDPGDMLLFAKVAELRSMTGAARALSKPKASVSRAVGRLESALNARLLERSSRHLGLTEVGRVFLPHCQRVSEEIEEAEAAVGELTTSVKGLLRVAVPVTFGRSVLSPVLPRFLSAYPDLQMELELTNRTVDPIEEGFDLIVRPGPLADSSLMVRELGQAVYCAVASPAYLRSQAPIDGPAGLATHRVLDLFAGAPQHRWEFERRGETVGVEVRPRLDLNDAHMRCDAAEAGLGVALVPYPLCRRAVAEGRLSWVFDDWTSTRIAHLFALWPSRRNPSPRLRAFLDFLCDVVPKELASP